jgi:DNA invertase Pin-like site-specific DNA recombinase
VRYVIYLRVSTDQQADAGQGLDIQEQACRAWLRAQRHRLAGVYSDAGRSGTSDIGDRPAWPRRPRCSSTTGRTVCWSTGSTGWPGTSSCRSSSWPSCTGRARSCGAAPPTEDANLVHDPDDPTRALVRRMLGSIAAYERDVIRLRLKAGRARKLQHGGYAGGAPPYGYAPCAASW